MIRTFVPGSEWIYFKIYCGPKTQDEILTSVVLPFSAELLQNNEIKKWFFIRYADPNQHLRIRFCCTSTDFVGKIICRMNQLTEDFIRNDLVNKIQIDTYQRELERYGGETIELTEELFFHDSVFTASFLNLIEGDEGEELRWLTGLRSTDAYLDLAGMNINQKLEYLAELKGYYGKEHNLDKNLEEQLSNKYRDNKRKIESFLNAGHDVDSDLKEIIDLIESRSDCMRNVFKQLTDFEKINTQFSLKQTLTSYLHMTNNRLFRTRQRTHELVVYDMLKRYYWSISRRMLAESKQSQEVMMDAE